MAHIQQNTHDSDEEFEDALSDAPTPAQPNARKASSDEVIGEILQKQKDLTLCDDDDDDDDGDEGDDGDPDARGDDADDVRGDNATLLREDASVEPEQDDIDEQQLREREKTLSEEETQRNKEEADRMKLQGNEHFKNDEADRSIGVYTEALRICPTKYAQERAVLFGNRAAAKIKIDCKKAAIQDCSKAIELWPEYVRAILRRAKLYEHEEKLEEALEDYKRVNELDPGQREAREAMVRLPPLIQERNERLKDEMVSKLKDLGNIILKPFGLSTSNFQMEKNPETGSYSINFNQK